MLKKLVVTYSVYSTAYGIRKALKALKDVPLMSYDCEVRSKYSVRERAEAKELLKCCKEEMLPEDTILCKLVANSSGLSYPAITKVTHFIFGLSETHSEIMVTDDPKVEQMILEWVADFTGKLIIHNSTFDLKIVYQRTGRLPIDYEDTQLLAKCYMNHVDTWKANTGLKELMGMYYDARWTEVDDYDVEDYKDEDFLRYCAIDGSATYKLWQQLQSTE